MEMTQRPETWNDKQWEMYQKLTAAVAANETRRLNQPSILNKAPAGGWSDKDRVSK